MSDLEKQAIEKLHNGKEMDLISIIRTFKREGIENFVVTKKETVDTVLNLIEKQQKIIEEQKSLYSHLSRDVQKAVDYTFELNKEIEKKDKIIDEMAEYIDLLDIDEDICKNVKDKNCDEENLGRCVDCIKEYFKKKVEDK